MPHPIPPGDLPPVPPKNRPSENEKPIGNMNKSVATIAVVCVVVFVGGCRAPSDTIRISKVSLVELLAKPAQYDGKRVLVSGFYHYEFESSGLYLSRDDARFGVLRN